MCRNELLTASRTDASARLAGVVIECLAWSALLHRYDSESTLLYLDPPYWGSEGAYGRALFTREDFARMAKQLRALRSQWLLSVNDVP